jgi:hypothetical protein
MSIEQFELIMCDMYQMDVWMPNPTFEKHEFAKSSYSQWAISEFKNYLTHSLYPRTEGTLDEFITMAEEFVKKMDDFSTINSANSTIFSIARDTVVDIQDMLRAMK